MEFDRTRRVTVFLKSCGHIDIFCDKILIKDRGDGSVRFYEFENKGVLVATIYSYHVDKFEYYKNFFDVFPTSFTL